MLRRNRVDDNIVIEGNTTEVVYNFVKTGSEELEFQRITMANKLYFALLSSLRSRGVQKETDS